MPLAAACAAGCGGGQDANAGRQSLAWKGTPVVRASSTGAHVAIGTVENRGSKEVILKVPQVKVLDARGRRIRSATVFSSTFVRSIYPHNGVARSEPAQYPLKEQERLGYLKVLAAGKEMPLTVSWSQKRGARVAKRIVLGGAALPIPAAVVNAG